MFAAGEPRLERAQRAQVVRADTDGRTAERAGEAAGLLAAAFLRVTSRANFVSGLHAESRTAVASGDWLTTVTPGEYRKNHPPLGTVALLHFCGLVLVGAFT